MLHGRASQHSSHENTATIGKDTPNHGNQRQPSSGTPGWTGDNTGVPFAWSSATLAPDVLDHIQRAMASSGDLIAASK